MKQKVKVATLSDYKKVKELADLYRMLDFYNDSYNKTVRKIQALAANMTPSDIKYAIKESED